MARGIARTSEKGAPGRFEPRDTRLIAWPWQREKSVKFMKSATDGHVGLAGFSGARAAVNAWFDRVRIAPSSRNRPAGGPPQSFRRPALTRPGPGHISAKSESMAIAPILPAFWPLNPGLLNSHSFDGRAWRGWSFPRHDELIGRVRPRQLCRRTGSWHDRRARPQVFRFRKRPAGQGLSGPRRRHQRAGGRDRRAFG